MPGAKHAAQPRGIAPAERQARRELAAVYRLAAMQGWSDLIGTHISVRVPGPGHQFLINPYGMLFEEITASSLVKVDQAGKILSKTDYGINPAGFVIHSCIHVARPEVGCVMHLHTRDGTAVATQEGVHFLLQDRGQHLAGSFSAVILKGILDYAARLLAVLSLICSWRIPPVTPAGFFFWLEGYAFL